VFRVFRGYMFDFLSSQDTRRRSCIPEIVVDGSPTILDSRNLDSHLSSLISPLIPHLFICYNRTCMLKNRKLWTASVLLILVGTILLYTGLERQITLVIDGQSQTIRTRALTVGSLLNSAGIALQADDHLTPAVSALILKNPVIRLDRAHLVSIRLVNSGEQISLTTTERLPANLLAEAGYRLYPDDRLELNGEPIDPAEPLPIRNAIVLELKQAVPITVHEGEQTLTFTSSADSLHEALWQAGIYLSPIDEMSLPIDTPLNAPLEFEIQRAKTITIEVDGQTLHAPVNADNVGQALSQASLPLQGLDYSIPAEDQIIPDDRTIRIVRVREEIVLEQKSIPFKNVYQPDPNTELDQRSVVKAGELGVEVTRTRVRYEDGIEISRQAESNWVAKEPVEQNLGYGTQVVVRTMDTPDGPIEYWRAVTVYVTSYSPCGSGVPGRCFYGTSLGLPVQKGVVGVTHAWYVWMAGQGLYVPGYGKAIVADVGGGFPGRYWIDVGYTDADYVPWHHNVTIYFLTPVPANIPWILP
jgi:resuscitation-promoting factor RpfB